MMYVRFPLFPRDMEDLLHEIFHIKTISQIKYFSNAYFDAVLYFAVIDGPINIFIIILYSFKLLIAPAQTRSIKVRYFAANSG